MILARRSLFVGGMALASSFASVSFAQPLQRQVEVEDFLLSLRGEGDLRLDEFETERQIEFFERAPEVESLQALALNFTNFRSSNVFLESQRLPVGILAYETLTSLVYHEETDEAGDLSGDWPGYLDQTPARLDPGGVSIMRTDRTFESFGELAAAQNAWKEALESGRYTLL